MTTTRTGPNWTARLAWGLLLLVVGAGLAIWALGRWDAGARFLGVNPVDPGPAIAFRPVPARPVLSPPAASPADSARLAAMEGRMARLEGALSRATGSAGRADALLIAFAARRAVERGVALGYLEPLLVQRFGATNQSAVGTIITAGRRPETLEALAADFEAIGPLLRGPAPEESLWAGFKRELGSVIAIHRADRPSPRPEARYERGLAAIKSGKVALALNEAVRLPGAGRPEAQAWIARARRVAAVQRALDQLESAALLGVGSEPR